MDYEIMFRSWWVIYLVYLLCFSSWVLHVLRCLLLLWPSSILSCSPSSRLWLQEGALCLIVGSCPPMSSLSYRNMILGDALLPPGVKQWCLYLRVQELFTLRKVLLMQLYVALSLHFWWDSQLNTSEMFWIDISRWMICRRCSWISVYLPWRTAHCFWALPFFAA